MSATVSEEIRETFRGLADVLIPRTDTMPSATDIGVPGPVLDRIIAVRPDLEPLFMRGVERIVGMDPHTARDLLMREDRQALLAIGLVAALGFYMDPQVRRLIGYPGQEKRPIDPDEVPAYLRDGSLQRVLDRGARYRPTPAA